MSIRLGNFFSEIAPYIGASTTTAEDVRALWKSEFKTLTLITSKENQLAEMAHEGPDNEVICYSEMAGTEVSMKFRRLPDGRVNWRETLTCPAAGLNNRARSSMSILMRKCNLLPSSKIYVSEQTTPLYKWLKARYLNLIGSEFLGNDFTAGALRNGLRHEDLTRLSLGNSTQDIVGSFDCLEHIVNYEGALAEIYRVLRPGGHALMTFPFTAQESTVVRASIDSGGNLIHHREPEYHGDPIGGTKGILCYYHFGFDILAVMRSIGFSSASVEWVWCAGTGNIGGLQSYIIGQK